MSHPTADHSGPIFGVLSIGDTFSDAFNSHLDLNRGCARVLVSRRPPCGPRDLPPRHPASRLLERLCIAWQNDIGHPPRLLGSATRQTPLLGFTPRPPLSPPPRPAVSAPSRPRRTQSPWPRAVAARTAGTLAPLPPSRAQQPSLGGSWSPPGSRPAPPSLSPEPRRLSISPEPRNLLFPRGSPPSLGWVTPAGRWSTSED